MKHAASPPANFPAYLWNHLGRRKRNAILRQTIVQFPMTEDEATRIIFTSPGENFDVLHPKDEEQCLVQTATWNLLRLAPQFAKAPHGYREHHTDTSPK